MIFHRKNKALVFSAEFTTYLFKQFMRIKLVSYNINNFTEIGVVNANSNIDVAAIHRHSDRFTGF